jgi:hypothetical protein
MHHFQGKALALLDWHWQHVLQRSSSKDEHAQHHHHHHQHSLDDDRPTANFNLHGPTDFNIRIPLSLTDNDAMMPTIVASPSQAKCPSEAEQGEQNVWSLPRSSRVDSSDTLSTIRHHIQLSISSGTLSGGFAFYVSLYLSWLWIGYN